MKKYQRRRYITLIEMMIVMMIIAMISGVIAYNYQGSLNEGKAFKTRESIEKIKTILSLEKEERMDFDLARWHEYIRQSPLVNNPEALIRDGWGNNFEVYYLESGDGMREIDVRSPQLERYEQAKKAKK